MKRYHPTRNPLLRRLILNAVGWLRPEVLTAEFGFKLWVPKREKSMLLLHLFLKGYYEKAESIRVQQLLREGDVAVDVGANIGYYTCLMSRAVGSRGSVLAFEPVPSNIGILKQNIQVNELNNVQLFEFALGDSTERAPIYIDHEDFGGHSILGSGNLHPNLEVSVVRFDEIVPDQPVKLVKIDVEGYELNVLRGMEGHLKKGTVHNIFVEFTPSKIAQSGQNPEEFFAIADEYGMVGEVLSNTADEPGISLAQVRDNLSAYCRNNWTHFNILLQLK